MEVTISLDDEIKERLEKVAVEWGVETNDLAARLIEEGLPLAEARLRPRPHILDISTEERSRRLQEWISMPRPGIAVPPPEAWDRENLYEGR